MMMIELLSCFDDEVSLSHSQISRSFSFFGSVTRSFQFPSPYYCCNPYFDILGPFSRRWRCICVSVCLLALSLSVQKQALGRILYIHPRNSRSNASLCSAMLCFVARGGRGLALSSLFYLPIFSSPLLIL
ncbi:hypothetical protein BO85DRAFT_305307 [Aspergillus piperis CBS 112811]|uniref:Uncharacterized protein n=1 Tax=Aspergillus piperis CBS 112811 TaxID=1448313 RepID=A0A8G1R1M5_9EURO|nr:hypothetical protein BO85DRAFT_305307 [Aspergillus piperis CBS 112811]RAH57527.1 hypothetical protein BO85DRAFT_305307 [Aspergillus piperis CBS 112811]